jgi:SAM-dependent methyltransferase
MERRLAFGTVADLYDRVRPSYPSALIDDVIAFAGLDGAGRALEVGAGTGKATVLFAARGVALHALEPSAAMAAVARGNCEPYEHVTIEQSEFERWSPGAERFQLLFSAQAWHWIAPEVRCTKAREVLQNGGALALFWNRPRWSESPVRAELRAAYARAAPEFGPSSGPGPMHPGTESPPELWGDWERELEAAAGFGAVENHLYDWSSEYSTADYLALLRTHSDHIVLGEERLSGLLDAVGRVLDRHAGRLSLGQATRLTMTRAT